MSTTSANRVFVLANGWKLLIVRVIRHQHWCKLEQDAATTQLALGHNYEPCQCHCANCMLLLHPTPICPMLVPRTPHCQQLALEVLFLPSTSTNSTCTYGGYRLQLALVQGLFLVALAHTLPHACIVTCIGMVVVVMVVVCGHHMSKP